MDRLRIIQELDTPEGRDWDVLVVGGGAVGCGVALDACSRGYRTLLVEQADFGQATSSRSTKLIHGGVRYLQQGNIKLVREALRERGKLLENASDLVHPLRFLIPNQRRRDRWLFGAGMKIYDWLAGQYCIERSKHLGKEAFNKALPALVPDDFRGATSYFDAQFDDSRLIVALTKTVVQQGGSVCNRVRLKGFKKFAGRIGGAKLVDRETKEEFEVTAKTVINATGIFSDQVRRLDDESAANALRFSQGIHLTFDGKFWKSKDALIVPKTSDGRVLFAIPWLGSLIVGTTDTPIDSPVMEPEAREAEIDFVLTQLNHYLDVAISKDQIRSVFTGIRPLVRPASKTNSTSKISREHQVRVSDSGLVSVLGGKWTTFRKMAEDAIDTAIQSSTLPPKKSATDSLTLVPASNADCIQSPKDRLHPELPYSEAAFRDAIQNEMARSIDDVLARRTRSLFLNVAASLELAPLVADWLAEAIDQGSQWKADQLSSFQELAKSYQVH